LKRPVTALKKAGIKRRRLTIDTENSEEGVDAEHAKKVLRDGYGCIDFLPTDLPDGETEESLNEMQHVICISVDC
jgi:hypothetical protein